MKGAACAGRKCLSCGKRSDMHECQHPESYPKEKVPEIIVTVHKGCGVWASYDGQEAAKMDRDSVNTAPPWLAFYLGALARQVDFEAFADGLPTTVPSIKQAPRWAKEALAAAALSALAEPEPKEPKPC